MEVSTSSLYEKLSKALKDNNDLIKECQDIAADIQNGKIKLLALVEELGPFLTDKNPTARAQGTLALSATLRQLPKDFLNETELNFITTFYCDRMKDNFEVIPFVLQGILAIVEMSCLPQDSPSRLLNVMFQHVQCQSQLQPNRKIIYLIFQTLLENKSDDLRAMGLDLICGVISAIDGERDPRNLTLIFDIIPRFIKQFPLGHLTEEMFEVIACYFPVDFNSSASEAQSVTRDDLANSLAPCLYASPEFAEHCLPLIIERLDSSLRLAKLDSLNLLRDGASTYGAAGLKPHLDELWPVLRKEVYPGGDEELRNSGLQTVTELTRVLSKDKETRDNFIIKILTDVKSSLCDVQLSLFWPAEKLLEAVARADKNASCQVLKTFVPLCLGQYSTETSFANRVTLTEGLNNFMAICEEQGFTIKTIPELAWSDIPTLYLNALDTDNVELKKKTFSGLTIMRSSLNETARKDLYEKICNEVDTGENEELKKICHTCLYSFAKTYSNEILEIVTKRLAIDDSKLSASVLPARLEALCSISTIPELGSKMLPKVVSMITSRNTVESTASLSCLRGLVESRHDSFNLQIFLYRDCAILDSLVASATSDKSTSELSIVESTCRQIVRELDVNDQQIVVDKYAAVLSKNLSENNLFLLKGMLWPLRRNVYIENSVHFLENLSQFAISESDRLHRDLAVDIISVLINKQNEDENFRTISNSLMDRIKSILGSKDSSISLKESAIALNRSLMKALIIRGSQNSQEYLDFHINLLKDAEVGEKVANGFDSLFHWSENTLTEDNFCNVRLFYKQRVFQNLLQKNKEFEAQSRTNYLIALTHLIEEIPMELLLMHLVQLVPLLMESIALENSRLVLLSLLKLKLLLDTKHQIFSEQAQHFIKKFLSLTEHKEMKIRTAASENLLCYAYYPTVLILPFKNDVLERLATTVDDRKRLVRAAAVKTRTRWYLVGSPGEPKQP